jgi:hypothetical protein
MIIWHKLVEIETHNPYWAVISKNRNKCTNLQVFSVHQQVKISIKTYLEWKLSEKKLLPHKINYYPNLSWHNAWYRTLSQLNQESISNSLEEGQLELLKQTGLDIPINDSIPSKRLFEILIYERS